MKSLFQKFERNAYCYMNTGIFTNRFKQVRSMIVFYNAYMKHTIEFLNKWSKYSVDVNKFKHSEMQ